jgi:hypothetical protein
MTLLADYYCALPILSRTLTRAFPLSPTFVDDIKDYAERILPIAAKLRHAVLFRECIVFLAGDWLEGPNQAIEVADHKLSKIARNASHGIAAKIVRVQYLILNELCHRPKVSSTATLASIERACKPTESHRV